MMGWTLGPPKTGFFAVLMVGRPVTGSMPEVQLIPSTSGKA